MTDQNKNKVQKEDVGASPEHAKNRQDYKIDEEALNRAHQMLIQRGIGGVNAGVVPDDLSAFLQTARPFKK